MIPRDETIRIVRIFVSSPIDVKEERELLDEVVQRINATIDRTKRVRLELFQWERRVVPQIGLGPQGAVDAQTPEYHVYLGIMARRFGTPTKSYGSGTEKEFRDALKRWKQIGRPWILFYFDDTPIPPSQIDQKEYAKVVAFRRALGRLGLYATYRKVDGKARGSPDAFFEQVELHLRQVLDKVPSGRAGGARADARARRISADESSKVKPVVPSSYCAWLQRECAEVALRGLKPKEARVVRLDHVYVPLTTSAEGEGKGRTRHPEGLERDSSRLLLDLFGKRSLYVSGAPGSGKSMFCRWVASLACTDEVPSNEVAAPRGYDETLDASLRGRLPLLVSLRDFWSFLPATPGLHSLARAELERALAVWVEAKQFPGIAWADVRAHIERGSALLILDGVDEVPLSVGEERQTFHPRALLLGGLAAAVPEWTGAGNRVLVTSRPHGLTDAEERKLAITHAAVEDLADVVQALLARRWFRVLTDDRASAEAMASEMLAHVREREGVEPLTGNPMLLTAMCIVYDEGKRLPQDKHDLYARIVDNVLQNRYANDPKEIDLARGRLSVVAHGMQTGEHLGEQRSTPQAEATYDEIDRMIQLYREQSSWTEPGFKGTVTTREDLLSQSGLLLPHADRRAGFYHVSFQEFLAAERLADLGADRLSVVFRERAAAPEWRSTLSFVFGSVLARNSSPEHGVRLLTRLVEQAQPEEYGFQLIIGECVEILLWRGIHLQPDAEARVQAFCLSAIKGEAPLRERHALGLTLGRLGDPRITTDLHDGSAYVEIPSGDYVLGDERKGFTLKRSFPMSRYPVTNSQYARFVTDGGYDNDRWWSEGARRWLGESRAREPRVWRRGRWNGPNQPVVGVSFWEAEAFCAWAGGRLPTANEWECAARGPEGLSHPWGNEWEDGICNTREAKLSVTSAVGLFPRSRSKAFGLDDMAGNAWEWCGPLGAERGPGDVRAVVRGGSWDGEAGVARSVIRDGVHPGLRARDVGFRVVGGGDGRIQ